LVPILLEACPSAEQAWEAHLAFWRGETGRGDFNDVGVFAEHVVGRIVAGEMGELPAFCAAIESALSEGDPSVRDLVVNGLIEDLQNVASHSPGTAEVIISFLEPKGAQAWARVHQEWRGIYSLADRIRRGRSNA